MTDYPDMPEGFTPPVIPKLPIQIDDYLIDRSMFPIEVDVPQMDDFINEGPSPKEWAKIHILTKIGHFLPDYTPIHKVPTEGGIYWWMGIKIRKKLANYKNKYGYPVRFHNSMDTYGGVMFWISEYYRVYTEATKIRWTMKPDERWRTIVIQKANLDFTGELVIDIVEKIPIFGDIIVSTIYDIQKVDFLFYPLYENIAFYNTLNDVLIYSNWDKILMELNKEGY